MTDGYLGRFGKEAAWHRCVLLWSGTELWLTSFSMSMNKIYQDKVPNNPKLWVEPMEALSHVLPLDGKAFQLKGVSVEGWPRSD